LTYIDSLALVADEAELAEDVTVWAFTQVREGARIGSGTTVGSHAYIDADVVIGRNCKIQTGARIFRGATLGDGVFVGPGAIVTNDVKPRAVAADGTRQGDEDWKVVPTRVGDGASLGAGSVLVAGVTVGESALVAAGAVVTKDVDPNALVVGVPAHAVARVCACATRLNEFDTFGECPECHRRYPTPSR
jgi:acetyltransferase-like isoleucine patch superfamily enzyme